MLGLAGEDLIRKVLALADDFDLAIEQPPGRRCADEQLGRGRRPRSTASCARCSRARA